MTTTKIRWSAVIDGITSPSVRDRTTTIVNIIVPQPQDAAAAVFRFWLEEAEGWSSNWDAEIGEDEVEASALVMIHAPSEMAGLYRVSAERRVRTYGYCTDPAEDPAAVEQLAACGSAIVTPKEEPAA